MRWLIPLIMAVFLVMPAFASNLDLEIYHDTADGKKYGNIEGKPGETAKGYIQAENINTKSGDEYNMEDISITMTIEEIDDGDDDSIDFDSFDLDHKKKKSIPFEISIPLRIEEGSHTLTVDAEGDENDETFTESESFNLRIIKDEHALYMNQLSLSSNNLGCSGVTDLSYEVYNIGSNDEKVVLSARNEYLGIAADDSFSISEYNDDADDVYESSVKLTVPADAVTGTYPVKVSLSYSGLTLEKTINMNIKCMASKPAATNQQGQNQPAQTTQNKTTVSNTQTQTVNNIPAVNPVTNDPSKRPIPEYVPVRETGKSSLSILLPIIVAVLVIIAVVVFLIYRKKEE